MELSLNSDQLQFKDSIRRFLADRSEQELRHAPTVEQRRATWDALAELGVQGLVVPEKLGGFSGAPEDLAVVAIELGREPVGTPRFEMAVLAAQIMCAAESEAAARLREQFVAGELRPAFAAYEAADDFDLAQIKAEVSDADGGFRLSGHKIMVVNGDDANLLIVVAKHADGRFMVFAVDPAAEGISVSSYQLADYTPSADIRFDAVFIPQEALLLSGVQAKTRLQKCIDQAMVMLCASVVGSMERSIERTREFLDIREQFGKPLSHNQSLQHQVADLYIKTTDCRSMVYRAIAAVHSDAVEAARAAAACKVKICEAARFVTGQALHLHGGIGFTTEYPIGHHFRRAFVDEKMFGDTEYHLTRFLALSADSSSNKAGDEEQKLNPISGVDMCSRQRS